MSPTSEEIATEIERRNKDLTDKIDELEAKRQEAQLEIENLQLKDSRDDNEEKRLADLKLARKEAGQMSGVLADERIALLDGLPVIENATERLNAIAAKLKEDAQLIENVAKRLKRVTEAIKKAESVIVKVASIIGPMMT